MLKKGPASIAFALVEVAAVLLIFSPLNFLSMKYGNEVTQFFLGLIWLALSVGAVYRHKKGWVWPF